MPLKSLLSLISVHFIYFKIITAQNSIPTYQDTNGYLTGNCTNPEMNKVLCERRSDICAASYCSTNETFDCLDIPNSILLCDYFGRVKSVLTCYCVTYDECPDDIMIGSCIYTCHFHILQYFTLKTSENICEKFNRKGPLCGQCKDGYSVPVYSYDVSCVTCNDNSDWWKFILVAFLPLTIFCIVIVIFKIDIHSSYLQGYIFYCQAVTALPLARNIHSVANNSNALTKVSIYIVGTLYGMWNLDFFRFFSPSICLQKNTLGTTFLDLAVAVYPILLLLIFYILIMAHGKNIKIVVIPWKPFKAILRLFQTSWNYKTSLINSFSTFYFLLGIKCINVCIDVLVPVHVYKLSSNGVTSSYRLYYDASLHYFKLSHIPTAIFGLFIFCVVAVIPTLLLFLYPFKCFQNILSRLPCRVSIHTFVDTVQGCYKDGTERGTRDYRWLSSFVFGSRIIFALLYGYTLNSSFIIATAIILTVVIMVFIIINPYKHRYKELNTSTAIYLLLLASFCLACDIYDRYVYLSTFIYIIVFIVCIMPLIYTCILTMYYLNRHSNICASLKNAVCRNTAYIP